MNNLLVNQCLNVIDIQRFQIVVYVLITNVKTNVYAAISVNSNNIKTMKTKYFK